MGYRGAPRSPLLRIRGTRRRTHELFEVGAGGRLGWYVDWGIIVLIVVSVIAVTLETVDSLFALYERQFFLIEVVAVSVFSVEYLGRIWAAPEHPKFAHPVWGRLRYALSPYMVVDLLAILPFYLGVFIDLRFLRSLRLLRFLRLLRLAQYSESLQLFVRAIKMKRDELLITSFVGVVILVIASSLMYFAERTAQPDIFTSIPASIYWGVVTLTTVGYGDVTPITMAGKVLGMVVAITGIGIVALPASILASGFIDAAREQTTRCPHCKEEIFELDFEE